VACPVPTIAFVNLCSKMGLAMQDYSSGAPTHLPCPMLSAAEF